MERNFIISIIKGRARLILMVFAALLFVLPTSSKAEKGGTSMDTEIMAALSVNGYDYSVKVIVNGVDIGVTGGKSEGRRLMHKDSEMAKQAPPDKRRQYFMLETGENKIVVEFAKLKDDKYSHLDIIMEAEGYPTPVLVLQTRNRTKGKFEKTFTIKAEAPADFKPAMETDDGAGRAAIVHVKSSSASVTPVLNDKAAMTISGMPGTVVLEGVRQGKNELTVHYEGKAKAELKFIVVTPEGIKQITKTLPDGDRHSEDFSFTAK